MPRPVVKVRHCCDLCSANKESVAEYGGIYVCVKHNGIVEAIVSEDRERVEKAKAKRLAVA